MKVSDVETALVPKGVEVRLSPRAKEGRTYWCKQMRCASKGNKVTLTHLHKILPVKPMETRQREDIYARQRGGCLTVRQLRQLRRMARRKGEPTGLYEWPV
jgi:NADH:ubiquinone oxidoreductase subunit E